MSSEAVTELHHFHEFLGQQLQGDGTPMTNNVQQLIAASQALVQASEGAGGWSFGVLSTKTGIFRDFVGSSVKDRFAYLASRRD